MGVKFEYPAYNPTVELNLRNPVERDSDAIELDVSIYASRDNTVRTIIHTDQQRAISSVLSFNAICLSEIVGIEQFFKDAIGEYLKYTDYNSDEWICRIVNDEFDFIADGEDNHSFNLTIVRWEND